jgi:hypothetical protein
LLAAEEVDGVNHIERIFLERTALFDVISFGSNHLLLSELFSLCVSVRSMQADGKAGVKPFRRQQKVWVSLLVSNMFSVCGKDKVDVHHTVKCVLYKKYHSFCAVV